MTNQNEPTHAMHRFCGSQDHHHEAKEEHAVKEPVCGTPVDPIAAAHHATYSGQDYYFCSPGCHSKFVDEELSRACGQAVDYGPRGNNLDLPDASRDQARAREARSRANGSSWGMRALSKPAALMSRH